MPFHNCLSKKHFHLEVLHLPFIYYNLILLSLFKNVIVRKFKKQSSDRCEAKTEVSAKGAPNDVKAN